MENNTLTEEEKKSLVGVLYNYLLFGTTLEVSGELNVAGIKRLDLVRNIFSKLVKDFSLSENIDAESYLVLGLPEFIAKSNLEKFSRNDKNKHLQNRAKYFLNKKYGKQ